MFERIKGHRRVCQNCLSAHAGWVYQRRWCVRDDHDLCPRCFRSMMASLAVAELRRATEVRIVAPAWSWAA